MVKLFRKKQKISQQQFQQFLEQQKRLSKLRQPKIRRTGFALGQQARQFQPQPEDFTFQETVLRQLFGHGEKIWGQNREPVIINNDLHPSLSNPDDETSSLFGFSRRRRF